MTIAPASRARVASDHLCQNAGQANNGMQLTSGGFERASRAASLMRRLQLISVLCRRTEGQATDPTLAGDGDGHGYKPRYDGTAHEPHGTGTDCWAHGLPAPPSATMRGLSVNGSTVLHNNALQRTKPAQASELRR